ncbi:MAG: hypothetical protein CTY12_03650 [Methylotenera sp.]|nr:MAG: hypothetical protein CTY14_04140 [Methylotenera sp.]PPD54237.1 MAG: hypothetical protein CTY12_03650 [Methylotenera sp.]
MATEDTKKSKATKTADEREAKVNENKTSLKKTKTKTTEDFHAKAVGEIIALEAYYLAERRGFSPGRETEDWLTAESIVRTYFI